MDTIEDKKIANLNVTQQFNDFQSMQSKYKEALQKDIRDNEKEQEKLVSQINDIKTLIENLKTLSKRPEWPDSFIPVNNLAYIPATIVHPSEHNVKLSTDTYSLMSINESVSYLERKISNLEEILIGFKTQHKQLDDRYNFYRNSGLETDETKNMPIEISSDKGVAYKTNAGLYEVVESYKEEEENEFYKKRQNISKKKKHKVSINRKEDEALFERLDELEEQESLQNELEEVSRSTIKDCAINTLKADKWQAIENNACDKQNEKNLEMYKKIKNIICDSDLYDLLLLDSTIQKHCLENAPKPTEVVLNKLIVDTLVMQTKHALKPTQDTDEPSALKLNSDKNLSEKDESVIAFLDNIENVM